MSFKYLPFLVMVCMTSFAEETYYQGSLPHLFDFGSYNLQSLRGKTSVWYFFQAQCASCLKQARDLDCLSENVAVVAVGLWGPQETLRKDFRKHQNRALALFMDNESAQKFGVRQTPTLFVLDNQGKIRARRNSRIACQDLKALITSQALSSP